MIQVISHKWFIVIFTVDKRPQLRDLKRYIIPNVCNVWYNLGLELFDDRDIAHLDIIKANNPNDSETCCREMFEKWLQIKSDKATWKELIDALQNNQQKDVVELLLSSQSN